MQLPVTGHPLHTRSLSVALRFEGPGRWRARGDLIDLRKTGFAAMPSRFQPAGIIHQMSIELRVDAETLAIDSVAAAQPVVAVEASERSGGECCRDPLGNLDALEGECLGTGFDKKLSIAFGGPRGCSHLVALFHLMAAAVPPALARERERAGKCDRQAGEQMFQRSLSLDGFERADGDIELALQLGDYHLAPDATAAAPLERLDCQRDLRLYARIEAGSLSVGELRAAERERSHATLARAAWRARPEWIEDLIGAPIAPGFAARAMQRCGADPERRLLRDALLQLAPGHFQVMAALADRWAAGRREPGGGRPSVDLGFMAPGCYMWRPDGPLRRRLD